MEYYNSLNDEILETFKTYGNKGEKSTDDFILDELKVFYSDNEKAETVANEIHTFFTRMKKNDEEIKLFKKNGQSVESWLGQKLEEYLDEGDTKIILKTVFDELSYQKEPNNDNYEEKIELSFDKEQPSRLLKKAVFKKLKDKLNESNYFSLITANESKFNNLKEQVIILQKYFEDDLDTPHDTEVKKIITVAAVKVADLGEITFLKGRSVTELAAMVDSGLTMAKVAYKVAQGSMRASDASDYLIDKAASRIEAAIHNKVGKLGGMVGQKLGTMVGGLLGPAGAAVGGAIGKVAGELAGRYMADQVSVGFQKVKSAVKTTVGNIANSISSAASNVWSTFKSIF